MYYPSTHLNPSTVKVCAALEASVTLWVSYITLAR